jgi:hypothetical protein
MRATPEVTCGWTGRILVRPVNDLAFEIPAEMAAGLGDVLDVEGKIPRALEALGPVGERDVALLAPAEGILARRLGVAGARVSSVAFDGAVLPLDDASVDLVIAAWGAFRGVDPAEIAEADRVLRPSGRLMVIHDYGRDDISRLRGAEHPEYTLWSRRDGPFLRGGFKIRVVHCFWTWPTIEAAQASLATFGPAGVELASTLTRPRLTWNIAIYHRWRGGVVPEGAPSPVPGGASGQPRMVTRLEGSPA